MSVRTEAAPGGPPSTVTSVAQRVLVPLAIANLVANIGIVLTGGVVRLTGSGLGCPTWPRCTDDSYVPHGSLGIHGAIEFGNRLLTFVLAAVALATFLAAWRAGRRRAARVAFVIGLGIPAQAVIGGITVLTDLNPWLVAFHLLLSLAMIGLCVLLLDWLRHPRTSRRHADPVRRTALATFGVGWVVLYLGTVVTGSGPHAGDADSPRTGLDPALFSHIHAWAVYALVGLSVVLLVLARRSGDAFLVRAAVALIAVELSQGVVGYVQYFTGLPIVLVALHLVGAALTSAALAWVLVRSRRVPTPA
ncbi:COX15/CtaA family protein [Nocardioides zeae]|uniref:COX15/CtaA family protein n=1 Tax=Nocardioides imazamoxiresistens TaxID=3231893 RepID=A0ABU3PT93_9ACTN|nr:COX15/CtaA family protein [Nocardioides zeae]MDT9592441.1 COX15/CtaA family protein [Nocardioides zeae]